MTTSRSSLALCAVFALALALIGCDAVGPGAGFDTNAGPNAGPVLPAAPADTTATASKLRHSHLLDRATRLGEAARGGTPDDYVGLIVGLDKYRILSRYGDIDPYRILSRYTDLDRYRILSRYEYENVFAGFSIWAPADTLDALLAEMEGDDEIQWIEPDVAVQAVPLGVADVTGEGVEVTPWGMTRIGAEGLSGDGVDLFVIDTGINSDDLSTGSGFDFVLDHSDSEIDEDGHGTHIAGTIAAKKNSDGVVGIAEGAKVHDLRVLTGNEVDDGGAVDLSRAIAAVEHVTGYKLQNPQKPVVVNFSLGAEVGTTAYNALDEAIVASSTAGVTYVIAAGNSGIDASTVTPAHVVEAITVGAYGPDDRFASFSNHGSVVDLLAPGVDILSTKPDSENLALMSGTSMAAAHVSGAAAVFLATNPNASAEQVAAALVGSAQDGIAGAPRGTTAASVHLGGAMGADVPPFFQYALTAHEDIVFDGLHILVGTEDGVQNANVFSNGRIDVKKNEIAVEGFGYYAGEMKGPNVFAPNYNPTNLPTTSQQPVLDIPEFVAADFEALADVYYDQLNLSGSFQLGTREDPLVVYVRGPVEVTGATEISGYGIIIAEGRIMIKGAITSPEAEEAGETTLGLFTEKEIIFDADGSEISAQIFSSARAGFYRDSITVYGSVITTKDVKVTGDNVRFFYRPFSPVLANLLWSM